MDVSLDRMVSLAQIGTFSLEFGYLSDLLNDETYRKRALDIIEKMSKMTTLFPGLYPNTIFPNVEKQQDDYFTLGGGADSFYEYLLKYWIYTGKRDDLHHQMYKNAVEVIWLWYFLL